MKAQSQPDWPDRTRIEPLFVFDAATQLELSSPDHSEESADFLDYAVARESGNLKRHTQRVLWYRQAKKPDALHAALTDLYIALGARGHALKQRLLEYSMSVLSPLQCGQLQQCLATGLNAQSAAAAVAGAVLSRPVIGNQNFIRKLRAVQSRGERSVVQEARILLEEGQVDMAQRLLEHGLCMSPDDVAVRDELRAIYRATRNDQALKILDAAAELNV